jgi:hypothetical protein
VYYWALAQMMAKAGLRLTVEQVEALMGQWLAGQRRAWVSRSEDTATGWAFLHLWTRDQDGAAIQVTARLRPPDIIVTDVRALTGLQVTEFERWEAHNDQ